MVADSNEGSDDPMLVGYDASSGSGLANRVMEGGMGSGCYCGYQCSGGYYCTRPGKRAREEGALACAGISVVKLERGRGAASYSRWG